MSKRWYYGANFSESMRTVELTYKFLLKSQVMSTWAVIKTGGKQYKVVEGKTISIEKLEVEKDAKITFDQVLAVGGDKVEVGMPILSSAKVTGKLVENFKDKKVRIVKFKSKSKYLRINGHRQQKSKVLIEKISS